MTYSNNSMRQLVNTTLKQINLFSDDAVNLVLGTIAQESEYGKYRRQIGGGPALGICQMEPNTFNDIVNNFLSYRKSLSAMILDTCILTEFNSEDLETNDRLAICMCRVQYLRAKEPIPITLEGCAHLYKLRYNTPLGAATEQEFIDNYNRYVINDKA